MLPDYLVAMQGSCKGDAYSSLPFPDIPRYALVTMTTIVTTSSLRLVTKMSSLPWSPRYARSSLPGFLVTPFLSLGVFSLRSLHAQPRYPRYTSELRMCLLACLAGWLGWLGWLAGWLAGWLDGWVDGYIHIYK